MTQTVSTNSADTSFSCRLLVLAARVLPTLGNLYEEFMNLSFKIYAVCVPMISNTGEADLALPMFANTGGSNS